MLTGKGLIPNPVQYRKCYYHNAIMIQEKLYTVCGAEYIVCSNGKILSTKNIGRGKYRQEIKQRLDEDGYYCVTVGDNKHRTRKKVHRIIAEAFIDNPDHLSEVDHIDNDKANNNVENLRWVTGFENKSKIPFDVRSRSHKHEKNGRAKINVETVKLIRSEYKKGKRICDIATEYNIPVGIVGNVVHYRIWKGI